MNDAKTFYSLFTLEDGTVLLACPTKKPGTKTLMQWKKVIDEDGVWREFEESYKDIDKYPERAKRLVESVAAGALNMRRTVRSLVLPILARIEDRIASLDTKLDRIEAQLAKISPTDGQ